MKKMTRSILHEFYLPSNSDALFESDLKHARKRWRNIYIYTYRIKISSVYFFANVLQFVVDISKAHYC